MRGLRLNRQNALPLASSIILLSGVLLNAQDLRLNTAPVLPEALAAEPDAKLPAQFQFSSPLLEHGGEAITTDQDLLLRPEFNQAPVRIDLEPKAAAKTPAEKENLGLIKATEAQFQVPLGQGRILSLKTEITEGENAPLIAIGNPSVVDVAVVSPRQLRITGLRVGVTDLSVTTAKGDSIHYEIQVLADLTLLQRKLRSTFPDASINLSQVQNHVVVEGEARSQMQVTNIISLVTAYLETITASQRLSIQSMNNSPMSRDENPVGMDRSNDAQASTPKANAGEGNTDEARTLGPGQTGNAQDEPANGVSIESNSQIPRVSGIIPSASIVNLLRVPTSQQVLLKVRVAELNRTALRNIGANFLAIDQSTGAIIGTQIAGAVDAKGIAVDQLNGISTLPITGVGNRGGTTVYGIFQNANFEMPLNAMRRNGLLKILAEPNLVALTGQQSSFLVGGEYPVPVPQVSASGVAPTVTVRFKEFGVRLGFVPHVLDQENLRLTVAPEVSEIDFTIAVTLVAGGSPVPGLNVRRSYTTVEMKHGQTLAIAGLLYLKMDGTTDRIPGLGDMPILGPFFSNTSNERIEKELVILVTPYIVEPMEEGQIPPQPGSEVGEPTDWEFYFLNRIESRKGVDFRSTTAWDNAQEHLYMMKMQSKVLKGQVGFSE